MEQKLFPKQLKGYAIFDPKTGLWSKGGTGPVWNKTPKIWTGIGPLKSHLNLMIYTHYPSPYLRYKSFGSDISHVVIRPLYDGCQVVDVTTGESFPDGWINDYYFDYIRRQKAAHSYYAAYPVKFEGAEQWLTL